MTYASRLFTAALAASIALTTALLASDTADKQQTPWLGAGDSLPTATLLTAEGESFDLNAAVAEQPAVLIFYRGGWCPYCNRHLSALIDIEDDLQAAGFRLLAISPDQPSNLYDAPKRDAKPTYTLLSDQDAELIDAMGIGFEVEAETVEKYVEYGIDLERASGRTHHRLPHPAVYVVDTNHVIQFAHVDPNYRERLEPEKIVAVAKKVAAMHKAQPEES